MDRTSVDWEIPEVISREQSVEDLMKHAGIEKDLTRRGSLIDIVHKSDNSFTRGLPVFEFEIEKFKKRRWYHKIFCINTQ